jgi:O-antigen ligase
LGKTALWLFPLLVSMVLTVGKTALLSFPLSFLAYIILIPLNRQLKTTIIGFFIVTLGLAIPVIIPTLSNMSYDTLTTLTGRLEVWDMTWALIQEAPWFGHGMGSVVPELNWNRETAGYTGQAHNLFLNIWFQLGAVGLTLVASFFITFAGTAVKAYQKIFMRSQAALGMSVWLLMVFLTATMSGLVGFYLPVQYLVMVLLWMSPRWHQHQVSSS